MQSRFKNGAAVSMRGKEEKERTARRFQFGEQHLVVISAILLSLIGLVMIYSASAYSAERQFGDAYYYVKKQAIAFAVGLVLMVAGGKISLAVLQKLKWVIYIFSAVMLALVFIPGLGVDAYGATRWINLGFTTIQPSELSKFGLMIFLAAYMSENPPVKFTKILIPLFSGLLICLLIMMEPNMSITMCVGMALIILLYLAGAPKKWFLLLVVMIAVAVPLLIFLEPYRIKRFMAFLNPWENPKSEGYQLIQSYFALGNGGLFGVGLFHSRQKYLFLPFAESDFIFSVIGEETGLMGCLAVMLVFGVLIYAGIKIAMRAKNKFHTLLAAGLTAIIALQSVVNIAVVTGSIPPTGLPLPFISAGGTSLMTCLFVAGVLWNIGKVTNRSDLP